MRNCSYTTVFMGFSTFETLDGRVMGREQNIDDTRKGMRGEGNAGFQALETLATPARLL